MDFVTIFGFVVIIVFGIVYLISRKIAKKRELENDNKSKKVELAKGEVRRKEDSEIPRKDIFNFIEFEKIVDNMIVQDKGSRYTMVIQCKGVNYDLMSEIEQISVEEGFITFLNTLKFPIQLYVQATAIDLKKSLNSYKNNLENLEDEFFRSDEEYKKLSKDLNSDYDDLLKAQVDREKYANILEYAEDITRYVEKLGLNKHMLQRKFYIILSYYKSEVAAIAEFTSKEIHDICYRELYTRAQTIISGLMSCSVVGKVLTSNELAELLYISYNRDDEKLIDVKTALESGFYRLYSTSKDIFEKKEELMKKEISEEAGRRVKATIQAAIEEGIIKTSEDLEEEFEEGADVEAINIINSSDLDSNTKEILNEKIAQNHVIGVEKRKREKGKDNLEEENLLEEKNEPLNNNKIEVLIEEDKNESLKNEVVKSNEVSEVSIKKQPEEIANNKYEEKLNIKIEGGLRDKKSEIESKLEEKMFREKFNNDFEEKNENLNNNESSNDDDELII